MGLQMGLPLGRTVRVTNGCELKWSAIKLAGGVTKFTSYNNKVAVDPYYRRLDRILQDVQLHNWYIITETNNILLSRA